MEQKVAMWTLLLVFFASLHGGSAYLPDALRMSAMSDALRPSLLYRKNSCLSSFEGLKVSSSRKSVLLSAATPRNDDPRGAKKEPDGPEKDENWLQRFVRQLAELSLKDYEWRSDVFKESEADRMLEQSIARVRGDEPEYVRPMNSASLGPLGRWEKSSVEWLSQVIDEEGRRAERIINEDGRLVRPKDASDEAELGPLGFLEKKVTDFIQRIQTAEKARIKSKTLRPKDVDEALRGPLGEAELQAVQILKEIQESERLRMKQSESRGGEIVRPMDVPGRLGEYEAAVLKLFDAEQRRAQERKDGLGRLIRPKDAKIKGPLGEAEQQAFETIRQLSSEEKKRLDSITRILQEKRPMDKDSDSFLGVLETFIVGVVRAPFMLIRVMDRVKELLASEPLEKADKEVLERENKKKLGRADKKP